MADPHFLQDVGRFAEVVRPWITPTALLAILGVVLRHRVQAGRLKLDGDKIADDAEARLRDHYAAELAALRSQIIAQAQKHLDRERLLDERARAAIDEARRSHEECREQNKELLAEVQTLREQVRGLQRMLTSNSVAALRVGGLPPSPEITDAAERTAAVFIPHDPEEPIE